MPNRIRLDRLLSNMGLGSRSEVKRFILNGEVTVDKTVEKSPSTIIDADNQNVFFRGETIKYKKNIYLMMNKPAGYVSATTDEREATVIDLLKEPYSKMELFVAGRLDKDTEGLLILTNNGNFAHNMLAPKKHVDKMYFAHVNGRVTDDDIARFSQGVILDDGYETMPAELVITKSDEVSQVYITIHEGKFHQIKRMFEAVGKDVIYLKRVKIGELELPEELSLGEAIELSQQQLLKIGASLY